MVAAFPSNTPRPAVATLTPHPTAADTATSPHVGFRMGVAHDARREHRRDHAQRAEDCAAGAKRNAIPNDRQNPTAWVSEIDRVVRRIPVEVRPGRRKSLWSESQRQVACTDAEQRYSGKCGGASIMIRCPKTAT